MATMPYKEQLLHPNWQRKRLEILQRDDFACQGCYDTESTLHVHHKQYVKGRLAWEYPDDELVTLCEGCHETMHEQSGNFRALLAKLQVEGPCSLSSTLGLVAGWASFRHDDIELCNEAPWGQEPGSFVIGQIAAELDAKAFTSELFELFAALRECPRWVVNSVLAEAAAAMNKRRHEAAPTRIEKDL